LLTDYWDGLEQFFTPDQEILVARDTHAVLTAMDRSDAELDRMARAARDRVLTEHTATQRADELVALLAGALTTGV
jgi:spore maturation protein CgeB